MPVSNDDRPRCRCRQCGSAYDPRKARGDFKGYCSAACQHARARHLGYSKARRHKGGPSEYAVLNRAGEIGDIPIVPAQET